MAYNSRDFLVVYQNMRKARRRWGVISSVLVNTGVTLRAWGLMSKSVVQSEILYGSEIWVVTRGFLKVLEEFHYWMARRITGMMATLGVGGEW